MIALPYPILRRAVAPLLLWGAFSTTVLASSVAEIDSLNALGFDYIFGNLEHCLELYEGVVEDSRALDYTEGEARAWFALGTAQYMSGQYDEGVDSALRAIRIFEELELTSDVARSYGELGYRMKRENLERATHFVRQSIGIAEAHRDTTNLGTLYNHYGVIQEFHAELDSAEFFYKRSLEFKIAENDSFGIPYALTRIGGVAMIRGDYATADEYLTRSDYVRRRVGDEFGLFLNELSRGDLDGAQGKFAEAAAHYEAALDMPAGNGHALARSHAHNQLAACYEELGEFEKALSHHRLHKAAQDSLTTAETTERIRSLELSFETEKKDRELAENRLAIASRTRQVLILGSLLVVLALVAVAVVRQQVLRTRLRQAEAEQRMADEKLRISRELHDNVGAQITFLASSLDNLSHQRDESDLRRGLDQLGNFGRTTLRELRQTVWAMREEAGGLDALEAKLNELRQQVRSTGRTLSVDVQRNGAAPKLSSGRMLDLIRIAQEAVQNSLKHTESGSIRIDLKAGAELLEMRIADEGPGFDADAVTHVGGLANMRQRCESSGGHFVLVSGARGTEIRCVFAGN